MSDGIAPAAGRPVRQNDPAAASASAAAAARGQAPRARRRGVAGRARQRGPRRRRGEGPRRDRAGPGAGRQATRAAARRAGAAAAAPHRAAAARAAAGRPPRDRRVRRAPAPVTAEPQPTAPRRPPTAPSDGDGGAHRPPRPRLGRALATPRCSPWWRSLVRLRRSAAPPCQAERGRPRAGAEGPAEAEDDLGDDPRGPTPSGDGRGRQGRGAGGQLRAGRREGREEVRLQAGGRARAPTASRASCSPPPTSSRRARRPTTSSPSSSRRSTQNFAEVDMKLRGEEEPDDLRRRHDRLDDRARGPGPEERPLVAAVIYNRLAAGRPARIDATLRYELDNYDEPLIESELEADTPYNTRTSTRACRRRRSATPAWTRSRPPRTPPTSTTSTTSSSRGPAASTSSPPTTTSSCRPADEYAASQAEGGSPTDC